MKNSRHPTRHSAALPPSHFDYLRQKALVKQSQVPQSPTRSPSELAEIYARYEWARMRYNFIHRYERPFDESKHPRAPAGRPEGGQFIEAHRANPVVLPEAATSRRLDQPPQQPRKEKTVDPKGIWQERLRTVSGLISRGTGKTRTSSLVPVSDARPGKQQNESRIEFENPFVRDLGFGRTSGSRNYTFSNQTKAPFRGQPGLSVPGLPLEAAEDLIAILEHGLSLREYRNEVATAIREIDSEQKYVAWTSFQPSVRQKELVDARTALTVQLEVLNELLAETKAEFDGNGFDGFEIIGFAEGMSDEYQPYWAGGPGFDAAIDAFEMSLKTISVRGIDKSYIEFDVPGIASLTKGTIKFSAKAFIALLRSSPRAAIRSLTGVLDRSVVRFYDDVARVGYAEAVKKAGRRAIQALNEFKGQLGEAAAKRTLERAGYTSMSAKYGGNKGIDGVFVKYSPSGAVKDIIVLESKSRSKIPGLNSGYVLSNTNLGPQLSRKWYDNVLKELQKSSDASSRATAKFLKANDSIIRLKANVLDPRGVNRWNRVKIPVWEPR